MNHETFLNAMKKSPLFRGFNENALRTLLSAGTVKSFEPNSLVVREGEHSETLFIILQGSVNVTVEESERDVYICAIGAGEIFGEASLFSKVKRTASVSTAEKTTLFSVQKDEFFQFLKIHKDSGMKVLLVIIYSLLRKLREINQELAYERKIDINQDDIDSMIADLNN